MRPRVFIFAGIFGAAATVATAWTLEFFREGREPEVGSPGELQEERVWPAPALTSWPAAPQIRVAYWWFGGRVTYADAIGPDGTNYTGQEVRAYGLPLPALQSENIMSDVRIEPWTWRRGIFYDAWETDFAVRRSALPLVPCWPGLLIDSVLYAAVAVFACPVFTNLRRRSRGRRGVCAACAYPVGHAGGKCPECGAVGTSRPLRVSGRIPT